jgi:hypothetical protein
MRDSEVNREDLNAFLYLCKAKTITPQRQVYLVKSVDVKWNAHLYEMPKNED